MKPYMFACVIIVMTYSSLSAQNTFPASGNVGIGNSSPNNKLQVGPNVTGYSGNELMLSNASGALAVYTDATATYFQGSKPIGLKPNGVLSLFAASNGNIGIGTATPSQALTVMGPAAELNILVQSTVANGAKLYLSSFANKSSIQTDKDFTISTFNGGWEDKFFFTTDDKFGIGTTPSYTFHVKATAPWMKVEKASDSNEGGIILAKNTSNLWYLYSDQTSNDFQIQSYGEADDYPRMRFPYGSSNIHMALSGGTVGIGTSTIDSNYKLIVKGKIKAESQILVVSNLGDYVFNEDYQLMPIEQVEEYLKEHRHLPGVPGKAEIDQNGFDVGQMTNNVLVKVEELTLYLIEMKKENEELKALLEKLGEENSSLIKRLEYLENK